MAAMTAQGDIDSDLDYMLIELDDIPALLLKEILLTLERYELYRLCLMLCDRY